MSTRINIGLIGFGSVGSGVYHCLQQTQKEKFHIKKIVVKNPSKVRTIDQSHFSFDIEDALLDKDISLIIEVIDDAEVAYQLVKKALHLGKNVITANKKMLAQHLPELVELAKEKQAIFLYEAAVGGSIPIIRTLDSFYALDQVRSVRAIANGTCNYILTRLDQEKASFEEILEQAQRHGFAESDPTLDIDAWDATYKLQILIYHAFGKWVPTSRIVRFGIRHIKASDIAFAKAQGKSIKLIVQAKEVEGELYAFALPQLVDKADFLHEVSFEYNGVEIEASYAEKQLFKGKGAGSIPTASAVLSDVNAFALNQAYNYPKTPLENEITFTNNKEIRIYASSVNPEKLASLPWKKVEKIQTIAIDTYRVGTIALDDLLAFQQQHPTDFFVSAVSLNTKELSNEEKANLELELADV